MDATCDITAARPLLEDAIARTSALVRSASAVHDLVPGSLWTVQQMAAHLIVTCGLYAELAAGAASPYRSMTREGCQTASEQRFADVVEDDPDKLAHLLADAAERFLDETAGRDASQPVTYHADQPFDVAGLTGVLLGEALLHGYDLSVGLRRPWRIRADEAVVVLDSYAPLYHRIVNHDGTAGITVAVDIELLGAGRRFLARFEKGVLTFEASNPAADAGLAADPVAFLMVSSGRLGLSAAVALGLVTVRGRRPDVAMSFPDFFVYP